MNFIEYGINNVLNQSKLPREVLELAFPAEITYGAGNAMSLTERLKQKVVYEQFIPDLDTVQGETVNIKLDGVQLRERDGGFSFEVPFSLTNGEYISVVYTVNLSNTGVGRGKSSSTDPNRKHTAPVMSTSRVRLVGPNTVMVNERFPLYHFGGLYLVCSLNNDQELRNLNQRSWPLYTQALELLIKAMVYNKLYIRTGEGNMGQAKISDEFKSIIEEYSDAKEMYDELRMGRIKRLGQMSDEHTRDDYVLMGPL